MYVIHLFPRRTHAWIVMCPDYQYRSFITQLMAIYRQTSNTRRIKFQNSNASRLVLQLSLPDPLKPCIKNEDVIGAAPTGGAPITSEWSTILLHTKVRLILEVWRYTHIISGNICMNITVGNVCFNVNVRTSCYDTHIQLTSRVIYFVFGVSFVQYSVTINILFKCVCLFSSGRIS